MQFIHLSKGDCKDIAPQTIVAGTFKGEGKLIIQGSK